MNPATPQGCLQRGGGNSADSKWTIGTFIRRPDADTRRAPGRSIILESSEGQTELRENLIDQNPDLDGLQAVAVRAGEHENLSCSRASVHVEEHERRALWPVTNPMSGVTK